MQSERVVREGLCLKKPWDTVGESKNGANSVSDKVVGSRGSQEHAYAQTLGYGVEVYPQGVRQQ